MKLSGSPFGMSLGDDVSEPAPPSVASLWRPLLLTAFAFTPVLHLGAYAPGVRDTLSLTLAQLGTISLVFFISSSAAYVPSGAVIERFGPIRVIQIAGVIHGAALIIGGFSAATMLGMLAMMAITGALHSALQVAVTVWIAGRIPVQRQGLALGLKQSAIPFGALVAGISLTQIGSGAWRSVFITTGLVIVALSVVVVKPLLVERTIARPSLKQLFKIDKPLAMLMIAGFICTTSVIPLTVYLVESLVARDWTELAAGTILTAGAAANLLTRLACGFLIDRDQRRAHRLLLFMITSGGIGFLLLAIPGMPFTGILFGAMLAYGLGWGWLGVYVFVVVRDNRNRAATATALVHTGTSGGSAFGPFIGGFFATAYGYLPLWLACALGMFLVVGILSRYPKRNGILTD